MFQEMSQDVRMLWVRGAARDEILRSLAGPPSPPGPAPPGWRAPVDCVRANELCAGEPGCSSRYRTLRQCLAGRDRNTMLANKECQAALEVLQESPLYDCRCKRGMKKELQCLQIYWSIHLGLAEGEEPWGGGDGKGRGIPNGEAWEMGMDRGIPMEGPGEMGMERGIPNGEAWGGGNG
ncbi:hypothetical protein DUI87_32529 [Hirundo rustica rustica]|uniref:GDNF/GAS1 domain-containing protein n=1 Tax=Hirundo rustica rustica TaxID=333673 RepID=A0A3M0INI9_HIRRU|nr:hypothetical protein DUI87_32529 [Hirundo rustica rustica]